VVCSGCKRHDRGRLASHLAKILSGKDKPAYSPNQDHGDNVIVINSDTVRLTGKKAEMKTYFRHTGYAGGKKSVRLRNRWPLIPDK